MSATTIMFAGQSPSRLPRTAFTAALVALLLSLGWWLLRAPPVAPRTSAVPVLAASLDGSLDEAASNGVSVANGEHSQLKHASDALAIHKCLDGDGPLEVWKSRSWRRPNTYFQVCQLPDGRWGLRIIEKTWRGWVERTSFVVKEGTYQQLVEYISVRATRWLGYLSQL